MKKNLNFLVLGCSTFLDKLWSTLSFLPDVKKLEIKRKIMRELEQLEIVWKDSNLDVQPPSKKKKGFNMDIDGDSAELEAGSTQAEREFKSFEG